MTPAPLPRWQYDELRQVGLDLENAGRAGLAVVESRRWAPEYAEWLCRRPAR